MIARLPLLAAFGLAACSAQTAPQPDGNAAANDMVVAVDPPLPGTPGGLADDRTPLSEAAFTPDSAQGAANVVQTYFALIEGGRLEEARRLWGGGGRASGAEAADFAAGFAPYAEYHAQIGAPGGIEGAAGSLYVEVPVVAYGRRAGGEPFSERGVMTLRRVNDVPGATPEQLRWHIARSTLSPHFPG